MSGFKKNSRFSSLVENDVNSNNSAKKTQEKKTDKLASDTEKNFSTNGDNNSFKKSNSYSNDWMARDERRKEEERKIAEKIKEKEIKQALSIESFPDTLSNSKTNNIPATIVATGSTFSEKVKSFVVENNNLDVDADYKNLLPGWTIIKRDGHKNNIIIRTKNNIDCIISENTNNELEIEFEILDGLVELHENRNDKYIQDWGYGEWEKMFKFPNYDYKYFDKLDELYYEEMENEETDEEIENYDMIIDYDT